LFLLGPLGETACEARIKKPWIWKSQAIKTMRIAFRRVKYDNVQAMVRNSIPSAVCASPSRLTIAWD
jgi:hypothetical protein